ncbi:MAG: hypothetical protein JST89_20630 [Cyanobacteria bacterium SZAS-4]|nr:hypothetical protein [Cyanobacteria bacterium SZAS-4]
MDLKSLHSHFQNSNYEPDTADDAWKRLYGDKPFNLESLDFRERLATAKAWREQSIKLAQEEATKQGRAVADTTRRNLITSLCQMNKSQQADTGEQLMHDTTSSNNANGISYEYQQEESNKVRETNEILEKEDQRQEQLRQEEQIRDEQRQQEQELYEQKQHEQRLDEQRQEEQQQNDRRQQEQYTYEQQQREQQQEEQRQQEQQQTEQKQLEQQQEEQRQQEQQQDEQRQQEQLQEEQRQHEAAAREEDDRAHEQAENRYKELTEMDQLRQAAQRFGPDSPDGILSRFLDFLEKDKQHHETKTIAFDPVPHGSDIERPSYDDADPILDRYAFDHDEHDEMFDAPEYDYDREVLDGLLNSFDRSLDVNKDIDLSIQGPMLIDELDRAFDLDRDVETNWHLDLKATGKELDLDSLFSNNHLDENSPFTYESIDRVLLGEEQSLKLSVHERSEIEQRIDNWQDYAFDPILIREQNEIGYSANRGNVTDHNPGTHGPEHSQLEQQTVDQIMQQQVQQQMQSQIQQNFESPFRLQNQGVAGQTQNKEQEQQREDESNQHTR